MQVFISRHGEKSGPYEREDLDIMLSAGALLPTDFVWHDGLTDWVPMKSFIDFTAAINPGSSPAPPPGRPELPRTQACAETTRATSNAQAIKIVTVVAVLVLGITGVNWRSSLRHTSDFASASVRPSPLKSLDFDGIKSSFLGYKAEQLPEEIQGFRFGSSPEEVCANYLKQYGNALDSTLNGTPEFECLYGQDRGPKNSFGNYDYRQSWRMEFGFYQGRLVFISKSYRLEDPALKQKTVDLLQNYFHIASSEPDDYEQKFWLVQSDKYIGLVAPEPSFAFFSRGFFDFTLSNDMRKSFEDLRSQITASNSGSEKNAHSVLIGGHSFQLKFTDFQIDSHFHHWNESEQSNVHGSSLYWELAKRWLWYSLGALYPPNGDGIKVHQRHFGGDTFSSLSWETADGLSVFIDEGQVLYIGKGPGTPEVKGL